MLVEVVNVEKVEVDVVLVGSWKIESMDVAERPKMGELWDCCPLVCSDVPMVMELRQVRGGSAIRCLICLLMGARGPSTGR